MPGRSSFLPIPAGPGQLAHAWPPTPEEHSGLLDCLAAVPDPRRSKGRRHPLARVLELAACTVLGGGGRRGGPYRRYAAGPPGRRATALTNLGTARRLTGDHSAVSGHVTAGHRPADPETSGSCTSVRAKPLLDRAQAAGAAAVGDEPDGLGVPLLVVPVDQVLQRPSTELGPLPLTSPWSAGPSSVGRVTSRRALPARRQPLLSTVPTVAGAPLSTGERTGPLRPMTSRTAL